MVDIASIFNEASLGLLYNIHYIARSVLRLIGDDHHIATNDEEPSTSNLLIHPLQLGCSRFEVEGKGEVVGEVVVDLMVVDLVVVDRVVPLMRLPYHPLRFPYHTSIPHHLSRLP